MLKIYTQIRGYFENCTVSDLIGPCGQKIGHALEDIARPVNIKIPGKTCIPEGFYQVAITHSNKYKKDMIQLFNTDDMKVVKNGVTFEGIRVHGGNDVNDTEGCPLVAKHFDGDQKIWASLSKAITQDIVDMINEGHKVFWCITSN